MGEDGFGYRGGRFARRKMAHPIEDDSLVTGCKEAFHPFGFGRAVAEIRAALDHHGGGG